MDDVIGVVLTAYNQSIEKPFDSIVAQNVPIKVVIVDDASQTPVMRPCGYDDSVHLTRFPTNQGVQKARNAGWRILRDSCPYMVFSDGDVVWMDGAFEVMLSTLKKAPANVAYAYGYYSRTGELSGVYPSHEFNAKLLTRHNYISTMSLIKTGLLPDPPFVEDEERLQDWSLWLRLLSNGYEGALVKQVLFESHFERGDVSLRGLDDYSKWQKLIRARYVKSS